MNKILKVLIVLFVVMPLITFTIVTPMNPEDQYIFGFTMIGACILVNHLSKKHVISVVMILITLIMSTRYMYFRVTQTLLFHSWIELVLGYILFLAECYVYLMLLLSSFQNIWSLKRKVVPLPEDTNLWPHVDVYVPTYNEPLKVVSDAVLAAQCLEWPKDKLHIYILDDGKRKEFAEFATDAGVGYITRSDNAHAKAGNLNNAMKLTKGEFIAVFDCDHITTKIFLQATIGAFLKDPKLALMQTPHHFYSPDPIERNLYLGRDIPSEGELFYGPVQRGNDNWNATFFCGSCAVIRREALKETNGFAVETVTEDAHTALRLQRKGWHTAYLDKILAGGLATERTILHIIQRNRWCRGMVQIVMLDNPLLGKGLSLPQRLCYLSAMMYFFFSIPVVTFLLIPLVYMYFGLSVVHGSASLLFAYALPHLFLTLYTNSRVTGRYRYTFWGQIYDILLSFHLVIPTIAVLLSPRKGKFNVTDKGGTIDKFYFDSHAVKPHIITAILIVVGIIFAFTKLAFPQYFDAQFAAVIFNVAWATFNLILLIAAICVARETPNQRQRQRLDLEKPVLIYQQSGICSRGIMRDLSMTGCRVDNVSCGDLENDPITEIELSTKYNSVCVKVETMGDAKDKFLRFKFSEIDVNIQRELVRLLFSRPDTWERAPHQKDNMLVSYFTIIMCIIDSLRHKRRHVQIKKVSEQQKKEILEEEGAL